MKIAMIGQKGIPAIYGGIERHVEELATRLAGCGFDVSAYCRPWYFKENHESRLRDATARQVRITNHEYKGIKLIILPSIKTKNLDAITHTFISTLHAIFIIKPDVIHYHGVGPSLLSWIPKLLAPKIKVIATFHCIDRKHQKWGFIARLALRIGEWAACHFADKTITVSKTLQQYCSEAYDKDVLYIPNGVNVEEKNSIAKRAEVLKKFGLKKEKYLLMVSRLVRHKGAHYLIQAFRDLKKNNKEFSDLKLVIAGDSAFTDDYVKELKRLAKGNRDIVFTGFQSGKALENLFLNSLVVIHPSESEGLPIAVLEAMSYGKVVIASNIPENMEIVKKHGVSFENKNIEDLMAKMSNVIAANDLKKRGELAKQFVKKNYNWEGIAKKTKEVYLGI
ncbi:MAG TPA: glycosyltransferase family 4 protein [Patescibacteria group bacterium]|nr:glycosyltransferase family 4 protein [Patescibacteria group bacterium]